METGNMSVLSSRFNVIGLINKLRTLPERFIAIAVFLLIWELVPRLGLVNALFLPPASTAFGAFFELLITGELFVHIQFSLQRALIGYVLAALAAIPIGFLVGWFKTFEKYADPFLQMMRQLPVLALFPVFILLFGIGEVSKVAMIFLASFWSIFMNTVSGVVNVDPLLIKSSKAMGDSYLGTFRKIVLPAAAPSIFTGLRYSSTIALLMLVAAEMIGASAGLGYFVMYSETLMQIPNMYAGIIALTILGISINYIMAFIEKWLTKWKEEAQH